MKIQPSINLPQSKINNQPSFGIKFYKTASINEELTANIQTIVNSYVSKIKSSKVSFPEQVQALRTFSEKLDEVKELALDFGKKMSEHNKIPNNHTSFKNNVFINKIVIAEDPSKNKFQLKLHLNNRTSFDLSEKDPNIAEKLQSHVIEISRRQNWIL